MKIKIFFLILTTCLAMNMAFAQRPDRQPADGVIYGTIHEKDSNEPVEFANIVVYDKDGNVIAGSMRGVRSLHRPRNHSFENQGDGRKNEPRPSRQESTLPWNT